MAEAYHGVAPSDLESGLVESLQKAPPAPRGHPHDSPPVAVSDHDARVAPEHRFRGEPGAVDVDPAALVVCDPLHPEQRAEEQRCERPKAYPETARLDFKSCEAVRCGREEHSPAKRVRLLGVDRRSNVTPSPHVVV
jgi:hypothetical protein